MLKFRLLFHIRYIDAEQRELVIGYFNIDTTLNLHHYLYVFNFFKMSHLLSLSSNF